MAKAIGSKSYSIITIKPSLQTMDLVADVILADLQSAPSQWIAETRKHQFELIESFYLTVSSPQKVLILFIILLFFESVIWMNPIELTCVPGVGYHGLQQFH